MSVSNSILPGKDRYAIRRSPDTRGGWIGVDLVGQDGSQHARRLLPLLLFALIAALGIAALRIDLIKIRYAMASVVEQEAALLEEQRNLIVRRRQLRDPISLAVQARARGFRPATQIIVLREPTNQSAEANRVMLERGGEELRSIAAGSPALPSRGPWQ